MPLASYLLFVATTVPGLIAPDPAQAAKPVQVEFEAPAGCSGAEAFFRSLRSRTDQVRRADPGEPHTTLQVRLLRKGGHVLGELRVVNDRGGTDTRKVQGASCDDVVQALSLTAALAVDPSALLSAPASAPEEAPAPTAEVAKEPQATKPPAVKEVRAAAAPPSTPEVVASDTSLPVPSFTLGVGPLGGALLASSAGLGAAVASRWTLADRGVLRASLGLAFIYLRNDAVLTPGAVQIVLTGLAATACPFRATTSILTFEPCALLLGGWLAASGRETTHAYSVDRLWLSAGGILRVAASLGGGFWLDAQVGVSAPFFKRRFFITTPDNVVNVVGETPMISPIAGLGLAYGF